MIFRCSGVPASTTCRRTHLFQLPHQSQELYHFISGEDTLIVLLTGHGQIKLLIYQMSVHYAKEVGSCVNPIVFVISPLNALLRDQIRECERVKLNAVKLEASNIEGLRISGAVGTAVCC